MQHIKEVCFAINFFLIIRILLFYQSNIYRLHLLSLSFAGQTRPETQPSADLGGSVRRGGVNGGSCPRQEARLAGPRKLYPGKCAGPSHYFGEERGEESASKNGQGAAEGAAAVSGAGSLSAVPAP